ncbi:Tripartite motif-containing protein 16 [Anabarilius grahami]|uniref:Tripartite motif-containing protein 16 n=1 Tax=Anabarilius grahami TaxID=495550 RepID=A0A3N0Y1E9_ANAGA|nr:Tripartite motif-containing protein 16 [Anabarilius grahami]
MAEARISVDQNEFMCPVCLDLLKDPVAIPCGHSFCKICITDCWDQEDQKRVYSCPQCRQTFSPRPALAKNTILAEMVEKLKKIKLPADCYAGAGDVQCDVCTGRKHKAVKSCLVCLNSYCQNHLEQHESWFKGKRHNLTEATGRLREMICPKHDKILEVFCRTDQECICVLCTMDEHKNHDTVSAAAQRTEKQHQLKETQRWFQQRIQQREKDLQQMREASFQSLSAPPESTDVNDNPFSSLSSFDVVRESVRQLRDKLEDFCKEELKKISDRVPFTKWTRNDFLQYSHQLNLDLNTVNKHLRLSERNRVITFTNTVQPYPDHPDRFDQWEQVLCRESVCGRCYWEIERSGGVVFISVSYKSISRKGSGKECLFGDSHQLSMDLNTVNKRLRLSERNRVITFTDTLQPYPDHPDRFDWYLQVLCRESVCGRCYWEIEWSGINVCISVSYKSISRKGSGKECLFGYNDQSWSLICSSSSYSFRHNNIETELSVKSISRRIGVYVDHSAGTLSFYSISGDTMSLIHTVQTTFTQPLYPGFWVGYLFSSGSVKLC